MQYTATSLQQLEDCALRDHQRGLLTRTQLLNIVHRLDRISHLYPTPYSEKINERKQ
jgi:hypothetical protein